MTDKTTQELDAVLLIAIKRHVRNNHGLDPLEFEFSYVDFGELNIGDLYITPMGLFEGAKFTEWTSPKVKIPYGARIIRMRPKPKPIKTTLYYKVVNGKPE